MEIKLKKEQVIKYIEEYYGRLEQREVKAHIKYSKEYVGYGEECETCVAMFYVIEKIDIGGFETEVKDELSREKLEEILRALFDLYEFEVKSVKVCTSLGERCSGYGVCETYTTYPKFDGVVLNVERKKNMAKGKYLN